MRFLPLFLMSIFAFSQQQQSFNLSEINIDGNSSTSDNMVLYTQGCKKDKRFLRMTSGDLLKDCGSWACLKTYKYILMAN